MNDRPAERIAAAQSHPPVAPAVALLAIFRSLSKAFPAVESAGEACNVAGASPPPLSKPPSTLPPLTT